MLLSFERGSKRIIDDELLKQSKAKQIFTSSYNITSPAQGKRIARHSRLEAKAQQIDIFSKGTMAVSLLSRRKTLKRIVTPELELEDAASQKMEVADAYLSASASDCDEIASLTLTSDDGTTDSSDESCGSESKTGKTVRRTRRHRNDAKINTSVKATNDDPHVKGEAQCEVGKYMAAREMTPFQERMNALTILPSTYFCIMFFLSGSWLSDANRDIQDGTFDDSQCISWSMFPNLNALPPLPPLAAAIGIICHAPFSMIYHWKYAHRLPAGLARTTHWSRRMDQAMIHFCSAFMSYSTTGRFDYFFLNALFNMDCMYRQFLKQVKPKRNQRRIALSIFINTLPILMKGDVSCYSKLATLYMLGGWLFGKYPIGGWSHSAFHIVMAFVPPIVFSYALKLPASQNQLDVAAHCTNLAKNTLVS